MISITIAPDTLASCSCPALEVNRPLMVALDNGGRYKIAAILVHV